MIQLLEAALAYARRGWPVFPVHGIVDGRCTCRRDCSSPGKHPLVRRGLHEATTHDRALKEWWARWPFANVALATSDVVVIDIDVPQGIDSLGALPELPQTLASLTGGGGVHFFYASKRELRNHVGRLPGIHRDLPGVDVRGRGGYVVVPPSTHTSGTRYEWLDSSVSIAPAPEWLREAPRPEPGWVGPAVPATESTPYGLAALRSEIDILLRTPVGRRNHQLNRSAFALGQLIAARELTEPPARESLIQAALRNGLRPREARRTTGSGLAAGMRSVRVKLPAHH